jgi:CRP-like cAMP-binding protein
MKLPTLAIAAALLSSPAYAESLTIGCPLIKQYSEDQVNYLLNQARSVISEQEVGKIYYRYVSLKNECLANSNASRVVPVSATLRDWLAQNGVDIRKIGKQL